MPILTLYRRTDSDWLFAGREGTTELRQINLQEIGEGMRRMFQRDRWNTAMAYYSPSSAMIGSVYAYLDDEGWHEIKR